MDLHEIKRKFPDSSYNPQQFPGAVFKIDLPKTTTLIFRTGNMVCTGAKSEKHAYVALNNVVNLLRSKNIKIKNDANIMIQNVVTAVNLGEKFSLREQLENFLVVCMNLINFQV